MNANPIHADQTTPKPPSRDYGRPQSVVAGRWRVYQAVRSSTATMDAQPPKPPLVYGLLRSSQISKFLGFLCVPLGNGFSLVARICVDMRKHPTPKGDGI
jgi:hypothetical protein